ncbi:FidL-like protein [Huaxiibacter chinensis]|uniref:FidL-like protein n=1 Tax=Huaxiibacter chinensis TaxID=2899785 RepID=UPI003D318C7D
MKKGWVSMGVLLVVLIVSLGAYYFLHDANPALKCKAFSKTIIDVKNGSLVFSVSESIELYHKKEGMLHFEGYVKSDNANTYLERSVYLSHGFQIDDNTYNYTIDNIVASPLDTTSDEVFDQMWLENTVDNKSININIKKIRDNTLLVSSVFSPQFTCVIY